MVLSNDDLSKAVNIDMAKEYKKVGQLVSKTWANYEAFNTKVSRNKDGILGENPETKNIYMQVIPRGRRLHVCSQKVKEKAFLTWNENTMKNDVSGGKKPEKNKKNKGAGS